MIVSFSSKGQVSASLTSHSALAISSRPLLRLRLRRPYPETLFGVMSLLSSEGEHFGAGLKTMDGILKAKLKTFRIRTRTIDVIWKANRRPNVKPSILVHVLLLWMGYERLTSCRSYCYTNDYLCITGWCDSEEFELNNCRKNWLWSKNE